MAQHPWIAQKFEELRQTYAGSFPELVLNNGELQGACRTCQGKVYKFDYYSANIAKFEAHFHSQAHLRQLQQKMGSTSTTSVAAIVQKMIDEKGSEQLPLFPSNKCTRLCGRYGIGVMDFGDYLSKNPHFKVGPAMFSRYHSSNRFTQAIFSSTPSPSPIHTSSQPRRASSLRPSSTPTPTPTFRLNERAESSSLSSVTTDLQHQLESGNPTSLAAFATKSDFDVVTANVVQHGLQLKQAVDNICSLQRRAEDQVTVNLHSAKEHKKLDGTVQRLDQIVLPNFKKVDKNFALIHKTSCARDEKVKSEFVRLDESQKVLDTRLRTVEESIASNHGGTGIGSTEAMPKLQHDVTSLDVKLDELKSQLECLKGCQKRITELKQQVHTLEVETLELTAGANIAASRAIVLEKDHQSLNNKASRMSRN